MHLKSIIKSLFLDKEIKEQLAFLQTIKIFHNLNISEISKIFNIMYKKNYEEKEPIFEKGRAGTAMFFIYSGKVRITKKSKTGQDKTLKILEKGDFFGETAILETKPRDICAVADEKSTIYLIYKTNFDGLSKTSPKLGLKIIKNVIKLLF